MYLEKITGPRDLRALSPTELEALAEATAALPGARILSATWPDRVLPHGNVADLRRICGLTPAGICDGMELAFGKTVV